MNQELIYREILEGEDNCVCNLVHECFDEFVAPDQSDEGNLEFRKYANTEKLKERIAKGGFENKNEEYHEEIYFDIIQRSEIPEILGKHGFDYNGILNDMHQWTILEKELPDLCADRIDYTLRDLIQIERITKHDVESFLRSLTVMDGTIVLEGTQVAEWFVEKYYDLIFNYFQHPKNILAYEFLAKALRIAVHRGILNKSDFEKTDAEVIQILQDAGDIEVLDWIDKISPNTIVEANEDEYNIYAKRKVRIIDPPVLVDGKIQRLTEISENIRRMNEEALRKAEKGLYLRIEFEN